MLILAYCVTMLWGILLEVVHLVKPITFYFVLFLYTSDSLPAIVSTPILSELFLCGSYLERGHLKRQRQVEHIIKMNSFPINLFFSERDSAVPHDVEWKYLVLSIFNSRIVPTVSYYS
jgi:hypothetical protein